MDVHGRGGAALALRFLGNRIVPPLSVVVLMLLFWEFLIPRGIVPGVKAQYLGTPSGVWAAAMELAADGYGGYSLLAHVGSSLMRTAAGFVIAASIGVPLGIILGYNARAGAFLLPIFAFLRPIPALAFIPIVVIWFGIGEFAKVFVIFMTSFLYVLLGSVSGVRSVPHDFFRLGHVRQSAWQEVAHHPTVKAVALASITDALPACASCVYKPSCGIQPLHNFMFDGDLFGQRPRSRKCREFHGMQTFLFSKLAGDADGGVERIFRRWTISRSRPGTISYPLPLSATEGLTP